MRMQLVGNRYRVKGLIGEGGMAAVYSAIDEKLDRRVAIKILHNHLARNEDIRKRFHQEARSISGIDHPNIIKVYDFSGDTSEQLWIVTEILYGVDLSEYIEQYPERKLNPLVGTLITREICKALAEAHRNGIIHRDIKPENIMVLDSGRVKLMDFGIAKLAESSRATQTGTFMGSPSYMSPEQIRGINVDGRTDIYSLSVLYYEILCGQLPFIGKTTPDVINKIVNASFKPPKSINPAIPEEINRFIIKGMQNDRNHRYSTIHDLEISIDAYLHSLGFNESHVELERFFKNATEFEKRITRASKAKEANISGNTTKIVKKSDRIPTQFESKKKKKREKTNVTRAHPTAVQSPNHKKSSSPRATVYEAPPVRRVKKKPQINAPSKHETYYKAEAPKQIQKARQPTKVLINTRYQLAPRKRSTFSFWIIAALAVIAVAFGYQQFSERDIERQEARKQKKVLTNQASSSNSDDNSRLKKPEQIDQQELPEKLGSNSPRPSRTTKVPVINSNKSDNRSSNRDRINEARRPNRSSSKLAVAPKTIVAPTTPKTPVSKSNVETNNSSDDEDNEKASITIRSFPYAQLYLNDRLLGSTKDKKISQGGIKLGPGSYKIILKRTGYEEVQDIIQVTSSRARNYRYALSKKLANINLILRSNRIPALVYIDQIKPSRSKRQLTLNDRKNTLQLTEGTYNVEMIYNGKSIERTIILNESIGDVTFNASFD